MATRPRLYVEPFIGGGAIALALPAKQPKLLADINPSLIDCWLCIKQIPDTLFTELASIEEQYGNEEDGYKQARDAFNFMVRNPRPMWARRSALFLYLNARCFNGLWRTNSKGLFNVPFGKLAYPKKLDLVELGQISAALFNTELVSDHFSKLLSSLFTKFSRGVRTADRMRQALDGAAAYIDSPYDGTFNQYAKDGFTVDDQAVLAGMLHSMAEAGAAVWASNADTVLVRELYRWAKIEAIDEHHSVGSKPERRGKRGCVLIRGGKAIR